MSQNKRPHEPEIVSLWRHGRAPRCCHTCRTYDQQGNCTFYQMRPPVEFAATIGKCPEWTLEYSAGLMDDEIPF